MNPPRLESWYREQMARARFDISSSGVRSYRFAEIRERAGLTADELDAVDLQDSVSHGAPSLRRAIANRYASGRSDRVLATHGSSEAIALALSALLTAGDRVVVLDPIYHSLRTFPELLQCRVTRVPVHAFRNPADAIETIDTHVVDGVRAVLVNFPHNPTGITIDAAIYGHLARRAAAVGATLVWDAAMAELPMCESSLPARTPIGDDVVSTGTLSKAFGLPGLRVGWCIGSPALLERTLAMRDRTTLFLSPLVELIATRVVEHADDLIGPRLTEACRNLAYVDEWARHHEDRVHWERPGGGVCGLLEIREVADTEPFCRRLLDATGVLLVPGEAFERPNTVRLGYGGDSIELQRALELLSAFLQRATC